MPSYGIWAQTWPQTSTHWALPSAAPLQGPGGKTGSNLALPATVPLQGPGGNTATPSGRLQSSALALASWSTGGRSRGRGQGTRESLGLAPVFPSTVSSDVRRLNTAKALINGTDLDKPVGSRTGRPGTGWEPTGARCRRCSRITWEKSQDNRE